VSVETRRPITGLTRLPGVYNLTVEGAHARFSVDADAVNRVLRYLTQFDVRALTSAPPTLEDLFLRHYKLQEGVMR
jgi:ABC-2 type transport system ATP-binding protein